MKSAMRSKDTARLESIRMIRAAIQRREVDERIALDDAGVLQVLQKMLKQARDSVTQFEAGGRDDLASRERASIVVLESYLPEPLNDADLDRLIDEAIEHSGAATVRDMGKVMGTLKPKVEGRADMAALGARVRQRLGA
ncbi:MAG: GatB/YqeY domain-containing protein [Gammaproteobacteria bacterium]|nr:GatB/YqeY domain-containing protein [Gammaproteobacteria bacterium]